MRSWGKVPAGVWIGALILLGSAWLKDGWGFVLGVIVIAATIVTVSNRPDSEIEEQAGAEEHDDRWGTDQG